MYSRAITWMSCLKFGSLTTSHRHKTAAHRFCYLWNNMMDLIKPSQTAERQRQGERHQRQKLIMRFKVCRSVRLWLCRFPTHLPPFSRGPAILLSLRCLLWPQHDAVHQFTSFIFFIRRDPYHFQHCGIFVHVIHNNNASAMWLFCICHWHSLISMTRARTHTHTHYYISYAVFIWSNYLSPLLITLHSLHLFVRCVMFVHRIHVVRESGDYYLSRAGSH